MSNELEQYNHHKLFDELSALIEQGKQKIAFAANSTLTLLFWHLGNRINEEVLHNERDEYGKRIIEVISVELENKYGITIIDTYMVGNASVARIYDPDIDMVYEILVMGSPKAAREFYQQKDESVYDSFIDTLF